MSTRPGIRGSSARTITEDGAVLDDQIRDYQRRRHALYQAQKIASRALAFTRILGGAPSEETLEMVMNPDAELEKSLKKRAKAFPAEVIYAPRSDDIHHKVFVGRSSQDICVTDDNQLNMTFLKEESFDQLEQSGLRYIHLGAIQVRIQPLHQNWSGKLAFIVFRDCRETPARTIASMEIDLSKGAQLIYVLPDFMLTLKDFYQGIQLAIKTKGYEGWSGEANLST